MLGTFSLMERDGKFFVLVQLGPFSSEEDASDELQDMFDAVDADVFTNVMVN
tara:strand:- start:49 stop:204 length:156 start_codon:yes stop_codon:yes gene_type:complete